MKYRVYAALLPLLILIHQGHSAPRYVGSNERLPESDQTIEDSTIPEREKLLATIESGLELAELLPSDIHHRKITDAVVVLGQALQNANPILHSAVESAMSHMTAAEEAGQDDITASFLFFLRNLRTEMSIPNRFPQQFAQWMKNQITVVEATLVQNQEKIKKLVGTGGYGNDLKTFGARLMEKIVNFNLFIQNGLEKLEGETELQFNLEIGVLRDSFALGKYYQVTAAIVWDVITQDKPEPIDFLHALRAIYKRASPDLQPIPQVVLRSVEIFLKTLAKAEYADFLEQLGSWDSSTAYTPIPEGL